MGLPKTGAITLSKIREDTGLGRTGSLGAFPVRCRTNSYSGPVSMSGFRGNIAGQQLDVNTAYRGVGTDSSWHRKKYEVTQHSYLEDRGAIGRVNDTHFWISSQGGYYGDCGTEGRFLGTCSESGQYKLSGRVNGRFPTGYYGYTIAFMLVVVSNQTNYLQGAQQLNINYEFNGGGQSSMGYEVNEYCNLSTSYPYITVVCRAVAYDGAEFKSYYQDFINVKLQRT
jgi:hypothetical protein